MVPLRPQAEPGFGAARAAGPGFVPCIRVGTDRLLASDGPYSGRLEEIESAVIDLSFDYGGFRVRADDGERQEGAAGQRDLEGERQACRLLESLGAVDMRCLPGRWTPLGSDAQYLVNADNDVHEICAFSAYVLPQLRV